MSGYKGLNGLSHITLAVSDLDRAFDFYVTVLGFQANAKWKGGAYLSLDDGLWLALSCGTVSRNDDYTHIAFAIDARDFGAFKSRLERQQILQWKDNTSEGDSLYILDPDGHKLEIHAGDLQSRLQSLQGKPYDGLQLF